MNNRYYLRLHGEDCTANVECEDCSQKEICRKDIEERFDVKENSGCIYNNVERDWDFCK